MLKAFTIRLKDASLSLAGVIKQTMRHALRSAFNSPPNSEGEESSPLHLRLRPPARPPSAKRRRSRFILTRTRRWLLRRGLVAEPLSPMVFVCFV